MAFCFLCSFSSMISFVAKAMARSLFVSKKSFFEVDLVYMRVSYSRHTFVKISWVRILMRSSSVSSSSPSSSKSTSFDSDTGPAPQRPNVNRRINSMLCYVVRTLFDFLLQAQLLFFVSAQRQLLGLLRLLGFGLVGAGGQLRYSLHAAGEQFRHFLDSRIV